MLCVAHSKHAIRACAGRQLDPQTVLQLSEDTVLGIVESLASPLKDEGEWIARLDIKESGSKLLVVALPEVGQAPASSQHG